MVMHFAMKYLVNGLDVSTVVAIDFMHCRAFSIAAHVRRTNILYIDSYCRVCLYSTTVSNNEVLQRVGWKPNFCGKIGDKLPVIGPALNDQRRR